MKTDEQIEQDKRLAERMKLVKHKIVVMSGKGGVGKSTLSVNIARALAEKGYKVGLMDTDIHGPNVAKMLGMEDELLYQNDDGIEAPVAGENLKVVSLAMAGNDVDSPIVWRGPLKMGFIKQLLADVNWGELDFLVVDSPPGTGDEPLSVCQLIPEIDGSVIVTTPQDVAVLDSRKSINFSKQLNVPVLGVVENMSGFVCPDCGATHYLFGNGGGEKAAAELEVPFLGRVPIDPKMMEAQDKGMDVFKTHPESEAVKVLGSMVDAIVEKIDIA
ncbi:MAG: Mrp/NBP35 family ATP-binding protein [Spirochaetales bacterium]|uniref:Iron-sulfur cluster carrier protein n=1 Tax=Candidatus Thalassospirochaeta sargassi TaxID=3119039 RepID=A0AAJ1IDJ9_9SPIO|nr:Mrp/NBP35 family ATP-binding protein [Spirochaetales bacterium]